MVSKPALLYAQSGGVTSAINTSAKGVIEAALANSKVGKIFAGQNGILGILHEELIDIRAASRSQIASLRNLPGGAFGSCRYKLPDPKVDDSAYRRLAEVFLAHNIKYFLYNGGNDSQDTTAKISAYCRKVGVQVSCVGIPKTIDNDLVGTDCCPGYGSAAKYIATTLAETALDVASMARTSTKLFILEVMGRDAGWLTAAGGLAFPINGPVMLLLPEVAFSSLKFLKILRAKIDKHGYCVIACSEGLRDSKGKLVSSRESKDAFAHVQLGGSAGVIAELSKQKLGIKYHWAIADYMQRAARHLASKTDLDQAEALGKAATKWAMTGKSDVMAAIKRISSSPYRWEVVPVPLKSVANKVRKLPNSFISKDGYSLTAAGQRYLQPLIGGEDYPPFRNGLPVHQLPTTRLVASKLPTWK